MDQKEVMKRNLLEEIDGYLMQLVYLKDLMSVQEDMDNLNEKMQRAPNFTLIVECALIDSYTLAFMKLYDKSEKTKSIPNLIKKCKNNIHLFPSNKVLSDKLEEFENKLREEKYIEEAIKTLRIRRDSSHVHNDSKYFGVKLQNDNTYLPMYKLWALRDFTEEVLEFLFKQLSSEEPRRIKYDKDLKNLFEFS